MNGVDYMALDGEAVIHLFYSCVIDDLSSLGASRQECRDEVNKRLAEAATIFNFQKAEAARTPVDVAKPQALPFVLTPDMQQALGIYGGNP